MREAALRLMDHAGEVHTGQLLVRGVVAWLVMSAALLLAAKLTGEQEGFLTALLAALVASFLYAATQFVLPGNVGVVVGIVIAAAVVAAFYKTKWIKGLILGALAILIAAAVNWLLELVF